LYESSSFEHVLERLRRGENDAATEVFQRYAGRLLALARSKLNPLLRQKTDPEDVVQSAFRSFFHDLGEGQFQLKDWDSLWGLLVVIALRKCRRRVRYYYAARRDVRKEVAAPAPGESSDGDIVLLGQGPTASEAAILAETLDEMMHDLDDRDRQILQLRLQGCTAPQISESVGYTQFVVEGVLKKIRKRWKKLRDQE
jgi:RNA polymerase sigma-70 factor (ECF subfamily)